MNSLVYQIKSFWLYFCSW